MNYKKIITFSASMAMVFSVGITAFADESIPENLKAMAGELGCETKDACKAAFEANLGHGLELANKYHVYDNNPEQKKLAESFQKEVLTKLSSASPEELEQKIVELASSIVKNKPALAKQFGVVEKEVRAAEVVIKETKDAGVSVNVCSRPADTLSREELVGCLEASKKLAEKKDVGPIISEERIQKTKVANGVAGLEEALFRGEYADLGRNSDELGVACLRPNSPAACDEIAAKFFGPDGALELARARKRVQNVEDSYKRKSDSMTLITPSGEKIVGKDAIRLQCDGAFRDRDVALARACGELAVRSGFLSAAEFKKNFEFFESVATKGNVDLDRCSIDPKSCEEFLLDEHREDFKISQQIEVIMTEAMGFPPLECARSNIDPAIGEKCFEGAKRALPKLEELAKKDPFALKMVEEIRAHVARGEEFSKNKISVEADVRSGGGPGGCRSDGECRAYCSNPSNGPECIAYGAKSGLFRAEDVSRRFEEYNQNVQNVSTMEPFTAVRPFVEDFRTQPLGPGPVSFPNDGGNVIPSRDSDYGYGRPSPECMKAIQSGDFARAKELCAAFKPIYPPVLPIRPVLPVPPEPPRQICPALYSVDSCPTGQHKVVSYSSLECGSYYSCAPDDQVKKIPSCLENQDWNGTSCVYRADPATECKKVGGTWDSNAYYCKMTGATDSSSWAKHSWVFSDGTDSSFILNRTDSEYLGYVKSVEDQCKLISKSKFAWKPGAGDGKSSNWQEFGIPDCSGKVTVPAPYPEPITIGGGWVNYNWRFSDGGSVSSSILNRSDQEYLDYIARIKAQCLTIPQSKFAWRSGAGNSSADNWQNFGIPDCSGSGTTVVPNPDYSVGYPYAFSSTGFFAQTKVEAGTYCGGEAPGVGGPTGNPKYDAAKAECGRLGMPWGGGSGVTTNYSGSCPADVASLLGVDCHEMAGKWMNGAMDKYVIPGTSVLKNCSTDWVVSCSGGTESQSQTGSSCQWWDSATQSCHSSTATSTWTTTSDGSCPADVSALLPGCHSMGGGAWMNTNMTQYVLDGSTVVKNCSTEPVGGCTGAGSADYSTASATAAATAGCASAGGVWNSSTNYCQIQTCPSGQYWHTPSPGAAGYCKTTETTGTGGGYSTSCTTGQYWNGTACVTSSTKPSSLLGQIFFAVRNLFR